MEEFDQAYEKVGKLAKTTNAILSLIERLVGYVFSLIKIMFWPITFSWKIAMGQPTLFKKFATFILLLLLFQGIVISILAGLKSVA